jgi:sugar lactone lactonase YvrE
MKIMLLILLCGGLLYAQELPPLFANTPKALVAAQTIAEYPAQTFLENLAVNARGDIFITSLEDGKILRVTAKGVKSEFATIAGKIAGLAFDRNENLIVSGWAEGKTPSVFIVDKAGKLVSTTPIDGAMFLNGITWLRGDTFLIADSYKGAIWAFDAKAQRAAIWLADASLARSNEKNPFPAVNGLKVFRNTLYATNTERQTLLRIPISADGKAGQPAVFVEKMNGDDFALDVRGNLYVTTHVFNNVVKITPQGKMTIIAELAQGLAGCTALAFNREALYVVTNGGMTLPPAGGVQSAKVVRLSVNGKP